MATMRGAKMEKRENDEKKSKRVVRLGLIYSVEHQRFDIVYKDLVTNRIRIELGREHEDEDEKTPMTISAA